MLPIDSRPALALIHGLATGADLENRIGGGTLARAEKILAY